MIRDPGVASGKTRLRLERKRLGLRHERSPRFAAHGAHCFGNDTRQPAPRHRRAAREGQQDLDPELLSADAARELLRAYPRVEKLVAFGQTVRATRLDDASEVARLSEEASL